MSNPDKPPSRIRLTVSMPYWKSRRQIRRAVDSVLNQSYPNLRLIVVNDGDAQGVWEPLEDIEDPRLVRFDIPTNRGRYYIDQMTLRATDSKWWTPHDSDDESDPDRYRRLTRAIGESEAVFSEAMVHTRDGRESHNKVRDFIKQPQLGTIAKYPAGMWRTDALRRIGGPYPGSRGSYDTALVALTFYAYKPVIVREPLYHVHKRNGSLSTGKKTGLKTDWRAKQRKLRKHLFHSVIHESIKDWPELLKAPTKLESALEADVERLRDAIGRGT